MTTKQIYIGVLILVLVLGVAAAIYFGFREKDKGTIKDASNIMSKFPAKRADEGEHIKVIQRWINQGLNPPLSQLDVDGDWGSLTDTAYAYVTKDILGQSKSTVTYPDYQAMV